MILMNERLKQGLSTGAVVVLPGISSGAVLVDKLFGRLAPQLQLLVGHEQVLVEQEAENLLQILAREVRRFDLDRFLLLRLHLLVIDFYQPLLVLIAHDNRLHEVH